MKHLITTELRQKQTISPQVYQSLRILQMNNLELDEYIADAMLENPVLEQDENAPYESGIAQSLDSLREPLLSWSWEEGDGRQNDEDRPPRQLRAPDTGESLRDHLASQFNPDLDAAEQRLLDGVVDFVDETGYLTASVEEIAACTGFPAEYIGYGVAYLQTLDPLGVCARDLTECLLIQLERLGYRDAAYQSMVRDHLGDIAAGRYNKIARTLSRQPREIREMCSVVKGLHPKPGACFGGSPPPMGLPDIVVTVENGAVTAAVEERGNRRMHISGYYARLAKQDEYGEAAAYLVEKLSQAKWIIKAVEGRASTLQSIANHLADYQSEFFLSSTGNLRPLTRSEVAARLELHESTVSRAVSGKYLQCKRGTFPLSHFFAVRVGGEPDGDGASSRNDLKDRIRRLIADEEKHAPLSDSRIVEILAAQGVTLSRRVVAKYRSELCIPSTSVRREI